MACNYGSQLLRSRSLKVVVMVIAMALDDGKQVSQSKHRKQAVTHGINRNVYAFRFVSR
jgi:hypothetical protein